MGSMYTSIICIHANPETTVMGMLILNIVLPSPSTMYKRGLKIFGEARAEAVMEEMKQLHGDRGMIQPKLANMLTHKEKCKSLQYLMFLKKAMRTYQGSGVRRWMQATDLV
jgi:hypothetical protein